MANTKPKSKNEFISLAQAVPELLASWDHERNGKLQPQEVTYSSRKLIWWKCIKCGESWEARCYDRTRGRGCPYCAGRKVSKSNSLGVVYPELSKEWDQEKNGGLTPFDVLPGSNKKFWWLCPRGHSYQAQPNTRKHYFPNGCPVCRGFVSSPETSLSTNYPDLSSQWHPTKNGTLTPEDVTTGSEKKVWWVCNSGHEWQAVIKNRTKNGTGCPVCSGIGTSLLEMRIFSELKCFFPDLRWRSKFNGFEVDIFLPSLNLGIEVDGSYWHKNKLEADLEKNRIAEGLGLRLIHLREFPLKKLSPNDIEHGQNEKDIYIVQKLMYQILDLVYELDLKEKIKACIKANKFQAEAEFRKLAANLPAPPYENSLLSTHPKVATEWHYEKNKPLIPEMFTPKSGRKVWWRCTNKGHEYLTQIATRTSGKDCPYCAGNLVSDENSLAVKHPEIASSWDYEKNLNVTPDQVTKSSNKKFWWKCTSCGQSWLASVAVRTRGSGCAICSGKQVSKANSLASIRPDIASQWAIELNGDITPETVTKSSNKKFWWHCATCNRDWQASPNNRTRHNSGCPFCAKKMRLKTT